MYNIVKTQKIWFVVSGILMVVSIVFIALAGLKLGIDFTGGSKLSIRFDSRPEVTVLSAALETIEIGGVQVQPSGDNLVILKTPHLDNEQKNKILEKLRTDFGTVEEQSFESVGPTIGQELRSKAILAIIVVLIAIIAYISWAFRKVSSGPVSSWIYGLGAIIALFHDILIVTGLFAFLGFMFNVEIDSLFVTALLTILGFSIHDTIVVYDRIRENIKEHSSEDFSAVVNISINQTMVRSLGTSMTALIVLLALYLFGGESLHYFMLALIAGIIVGTYSSIFIASQFLIVWRKMQHKKA